MKKKENKKLSVFEKFASKVTKATGSTPAFLGAFAIVLIWAVLGPFFNYSETWQLVINTGTTIITFLMVFLIQKAQNKDSMAIQLKLNELVASHEFASNRLVDVEDLSEAEMKVLQRYYVLLAELSKKEDSLQHSHSIDEAKETHQIKTAIKKKKRKSQG
ncbi:low affinity iron permease family protein [Flavobacterium magnum]|uniref:Low affinity iron permease family protein n=1 Tax=Flavobacterium magnum TaxID=2162713 RepID=A0A2S0RG10_9FLAO|nr:low affinity iron permease family protein [Flavobacterium magnum]AWA30703.1 low affinity iron permease family protein [Flavobacterium magnum]